MVINEVFDYYLQHDLQHQCPFFPLLGYCFEREPLIQMMDVRRGLKLIRCLTHALVSL